MAAEGDATSAAAGALPSVLAVAEGPGSQFATLESDGGVSVWSRPEALRSRFRAEIARVTVPVPSRRLAVVASASGATSVAVASWTQGIAAFDVEGQRLWHRRDVHHVQHVRGLPAQNGTGALAVVSEKAGGLVLGPSGGTRHRVPRARFLDGWPDGSLFVFDRHSASRRAAPYAESVWQVDLPTFAVLDVVLGEGALICGANGVTFVRDDGEILWRIAATGARRIIRARAHSDGDGWICLSVSNEDRGTSQIVRVGRDGDITTAIDFPGAWIDFVCGGDFAVATDGTVAEVPNV
jgi:hypothetical protein